MQVKFLKFRGFHFLIYDGFRMQPLHISILLYACLHILSVLMLFLILCSSVVYTLRRFMFGLTLLFVYVFLLSL